MNLKKKSVIFKKKKKKGREGPEAQKFPSLKISLPLSMQVCVVCFFLLLKFN